MMTKEIPWEIYKEHIPTAEKILTTLFGEPKSSQEIADHANKKGEIIRILVDVENLPKFEILQQKKDYIFGHPSGGDAIIDTLPKENDVEGIIEDLRDGL